jgi:ABC-2 type transport system ATP-binding protein
VLHEVEALTPSIVLFHRGRLLAQGPVTEIRRLLSRHPRRVELRSRDARRLAAALIGLEPVSSVRIAADGRISIETGDVERFFRELTALAPRERAGIRSVESHDANLEAVFDYLVG